jgi:hypothetical protein
MNARSRNLAMWLSIPFLSLVINTVTEAQEVPDFFNSFSCHIEVLKVVIGRSNDEKISSKFFQANTVREPPAVEVSDDGDLLTVTMRFGPGTDVNDSIKGGRVDLEVCRTRDDGISRRLEPSSRCINRWFDFKDAQNSSFSSESNLPDKFNQEVRLYEKPGSPYLQYMIKLFCGKASKEDNFRSYQAFMEDLKKRSTVVHNKQ